MAFRRSWIALLALVLLPVPADCQAQQQPARMLEESWGNLDGQWLFRTDPDDVGGKEGWQQPGFRDAGWRMLQVPGSWEPQGVTDPRPGQPPRPKGNMRWSDYDGAAWYRLRFTMPAAWAGRDLELFLGSVDDEDRTFLNGQPVGATGPGIARAVSKLRRYHIAAALAQAGKENVLAIRVFDGGGPGGIDGPLLTLLPVDLVEKTMKLPQSDRPLAERFANPPAESRILKIIHNWPDDSGSQDALIQQLLAQGFGGVVSNVSFSEYLESDAKWAAFIRAVKAAKDVGMALWLYDEKGYPSGAAGGMTLRDRPEWEARGLLIAEASSEGGPVELALPPGKLVQAAAYPREGSTVGLGKAVPLAGQVKDGRLSWNAPPGKWWVVAITEDYLYEGTHAAVSLGDKMPYINLLMPEPTKRFLEVTHGRYAARLGDDLGKWFKATFTDEPSLMSLFMRPMPYRVLPWAPNLPAEFAKRRGYALGPLLPALAADAGARGSKARYDFWLTVGELVSESFAGQIQGWCRQHGLPSGGHLLMEEGLVGHVPLYGDFFRCLRRLDAPSIDCLTSIPEQVPWYIARTAASAAELAQAEECLSRPANRPAGPATNPVPHPVMCETSDHSQRYRPAGDKRPVRPVSEEEIRGTCNRLMVGGVNVITSYYSFTGLSGSQIERLNEWIGRCCTMLTGGHQVADIALLYPIESVWPRFTPARHGATNSAGAVAVEQAYRTTLDALYNSRRDFTLIDSRTLASATVEKDALTYGPLRWRVLVLPGVDTLPQAAWDTVERFWKAGGVVILGAVPANSESAFPSPAVQKLAGEMVGESRAAHVVANASGGAAIFLPPGSGALLPAALDGVLEPDVRVEEAKAPVRATHRRIDSHDVYFLINDSGTPWEGTLSLCAAGPGEQWDPATGKRAPIDDTRKITVRLESYGATLLRFASARIPERRKAVSGSLPGLALRTLPAVEPAAGKGEFVQAELTPVAATPAGRPGWRAVGTLTKGNVDTFLFTSFSYPEGVDLSDADCLAVETSMPAGQQAATRLLVILRDKEGREYMGDTGRPLSQSEPGQSLLPLTAFHQAGWSRGPKGPLALGAITSISIGWGGYFGTQGEKVEFTLCAPQAATLSRKP